MIADTTLLKRAEQQQEKAVEIVENFSDPLLRAMQLADIFEKIEAEEYVLPQVGKASAAPEHVRCYVGDPYTAL